MSDWEVRTGEESIYNKEFPSGLPNLAPPQYLDRKIAAHSDSDLKFYSTQLGLTNTLKQITPNNDLSRGFKSGWSPENIPAPFIDPPIIRSEPWSSSDFVKSSKKRRWIQFKSNFMSCIKSVKCRFTALGILLGLILSLGALIPIVVIWQTSTSASNPSSSSSNTGVGSALSVSTAIGVCDSTSCEEQVIFTTNMTSTALSLVITVQRTENATYLGDSNSYNTVINSTYTESATEIVYTFFIESGQLPAGNYTCTVQFSLSGTNQTTSDDGYSIQTTNICGIINTASGNFQ